MTEQEKQYRWSEWAMFQEVMTLVARYDWATEGFPVPEGVTLTRAEATEIRNQLVKLAGDITPSLEKIGG